VFARQIEALGTSGDTLIAFSTSGKSKNIKEAIHAAHKKGMRNLGISGRKGMSALCALDIICPGESTAVIQECHMVVTHLLCEAIERGVPK
jgi:D-sedoheptulose 7-phosphate isomerase